MTKKTWRQQADTYLHEIKRLLKLYEQVTYIGQEPYKGDFFKVFAEAFRSGYCTLGDRYDEEKDRDVQCKAAPPHFGGCNLVICEEAGMGSCRDDGRRKALL